MAKMSRTWWGQRFLEALEQRMDRGRLSRGRAYAGPNRLLAFAIDGPIIRATVRGNKNPYFGVYEEPRYKVSIRLKAIPKAKWAAIIAELSGNAAWISRLLMSEMPDNIESVFEQSGVRLLPGGGTDLRSDCSCPDYANPCKHIAGAYYKVASLLDRDPFLLFELRGMDKDSLQQLLAASPLGQALATQLTEPQAISLEYSSQRYTPPSRVTVDGLGLDAFWRGREALPDPEQQPGFGTTSAALIKRQGDYPAFWDRDNSFVEVMETIYQRVVAKNKDSL
jgi:uncharacterized Zn finger protein